MLSFELLTLIGAIILLLVHIGVQSSVLKAQVGNLQSVGARDSIEPAQGLAGRAERALRNFNETFPAFVAAVAVVSLVDVSNILTLLGCALYLICRVIYLPLYMSGVAWIRSYVWVVATASITLILFGIPTDSFFKAV